MIITFLANLTYSMQEKFITLFKYRPTHLYALMYYMYWFTIQNCTKKHIYMLYNW